jgi:hypothetical protein
LEDNIYKKLAKIRKLVEALQKNKQGHNYRYVTEDEILAKVTGGMEKQGLSLIPNIMHNTMEIIPYQYGKAKSTKDGQIYQENVNEILVQADMEWVWINNDNPEERVVVPWVIIGHQQNASMAFGSGLSYTVRYFLLKYFNVSTLEDDVDAWKAKQKDAEMQEEIELVKTIVDEIDIMAKKYVEKFPNNGKLLGDALKKMIRDSEGKPTANYYEISSVEVANIVRTKMLHMLSEEKTEAKKKKGE